MIRVIAQSLRWIRHRRFSLCLFSLMVLTGLLHGQAGLHDPRQRAFAIPAAAATTALKRFSQQAECEVLFASHLTYGVRTNPIHGLLSPREAIDRLLDDTGLIAVHDEKTGGFSIRKETADEASRRRRAALDHARVRRENGMPPGNDSTRRSGALARLASLLSPAARPNEETGSVIGRVQNAAAGQYLNNARVVVRGTNRVAFTDETGTYRLARLPAGPTVLSVSYTGLDSREIRFDLNPGKTIECNVDLTNAARFGDTGPVVRLDAFMVASIRETDAEAIAVNEQRHAINIKTVVAADSLGDVMDGNIGEFMKFLPGVIAEYDHEDSTTVSAISIRGFSPNMVDVSLDGAQMANTSNVMGDSRSFAFNQASINNVSRIEVTKVPTPANAASSLSGSVNMISKSAFERKNMQLRYNLNLAANSENFNFRRTPHTTEEKIFKILPGGNFDLTLPLGRRFGIVLTGSASERYAKLHYSYNTYNASAINIGSTPAKPYLQTYRLLDSPRVITRQSAGIKADWKVTRNSMLSAGAQGSHFESKRIATEFTANVGTNPVPNPATATPFGYGDDFVIGATGRGTFTTGGAASSHNVIDTRAGNLRYRYDNGMWRIHAGVDRSRAVGGVRDTTEGHFRQMTINLIGPRRLVFREINKVRPGIIEVFDLNGNPIDYLDAANYQIATANSTPRRTDDRMESGFVDLRRELGFLSVPASLQVGASRRNHTRDIRRRNENWTYNGIDGNRSAAAFLSPLYTNEYHYYGFRGFPHISPKLAWEAFQANPALFSKTTAQLVTEEHFRRMNSEFFDETVMAYYAQLEFNLFNGRLKGLTGVRYEKNVIDGMGVLVDNAAVWQRRPDGTFVRDTSGQRVRRPEAGEAGSVDELDLTTIERGFRARRAYDGYYPSLHLNYNLSDNLILRAAYARTYGKPNLTEVIPTATVDETDFEGNEVINPAVVQGNITLRNTGLKPWRADNFDLSLEYYTNKGGVYSVGAFLKDLTDFFGNEVRIATLADTQELGLDPRYVGWHITTKFNSGDARVTGIEFNVRHSLREAGSWLRHFSVFLNGSKLRLEGERRADFFAFTPESLNWGFSYSRRPLMVMAKWNYRGKRQRDTVPLVGPDAHSYDDRRLTLDLNAEYQLRKSLFFYVAAQNVFNEPTLVMRYGSETPDYAKAHRWGYTGVGITMGLKGTF